MEILITNKESKPPQIRPPKAKMNVLDFDV